MHYDLIIVGAGPAGLALAQCLRNTYKKILIIEKESVIGGCHRVLRVPINGEDIFTEHSPRVYSGTYKTFDMLLKDMNTSFDSIYTQYKFSITNIGNQTVFSTLKFTEICKLAFQFFLLILNDNHGVNISIGDYMKKSNFKKESIDLVDRLTRLTDGAGSDKYTLNEFLELFNQQIFYKLYQPVLPNDKGLFKIWLEFLESNHIEFMLNTSVISINYDPKTNMATSVIVTDNSSSSTKIITGDKIVLATPPQSFVNILKNSIDEVKNTFMHIDRLVTYAKNTAYLTYISMTFHWNEILKLPTVYGFPKSDWGIIFIVLTDYMKFEQSSSKTVISCTISYTDVKSSVTNKTANEYNENEVEDLKSEVFRQLKESFPDIPTETISLLTPEMTYNTTISKWESSGTAFITSAQETFIPFVGQIPNLFNLGTQNGKQIYKLTTLESAVTNAVYLSHIFHPNLKYVYKVQNIYTLSQLFLLIFIIIIIIILILIYKRVSKRKNG